MNVFDNVDSAQYDSARPFFHPRVYERLASLWDGPLDRGLDVACGTGHSAVALLPFAKEVVAVDPSRAMLSHARSRSRIRYVRAAAERLPFVDKSFDLVSVSLGIHWFDEPAFLEEAHRVLRAAGWLFVYDSGFPEVMKGADGFARWLGLYRDRFPAPSRADFRLQDGWVSRRGFETVRAESFVLTRECDFDSFAAYVVTQSRIVWALTGGLETGDAIRTWLEKTLRPQFESQVKTLEYDVWLAAYRAV